MARNPPSGCVCARKHWPQGLNRYLCTRVHGTIIPNSQRWKRPTCLDGWWIHRMWPIHRAEYCSVSVRKGILTPAAPTCGEPGGHDAA